MDNDLQNKYSDVHLKTYIGYLERLMLTHKFVSYSEYDAEHTNLVLWRHDIDFSISNSYKLAKIEHDLGVKATYFVHLHNENYNFLNKNIQKVLYQIKSLGHEIELHLCCDYYTIKSEEHLKTAISLDVDIFEKHLGMKARVFSFHNPTSEALKLDKFEYCGLINTYSKYFKENTVYASDSNGYWRHKSIGDTICDNPDKNLHLLTHPVWWLEQNMSPRKKIELCINNYASERINNYDELLRKQGRINVK